MSSRIKLGIIPDESEAEEINSEVEVEEDSVEKVE
jgi:hypothetical protein